MPASSSSDVPTGAPTDAHTYPRTIFPTALSTNAPTCPRTNFLTNVLTNVRTTGTPTGAPTSFNYNWTDEDCNDAGVITFLSTGEVQDAQNIITEGHQLPSKLTSNCLSFGVILGKAIHLSSSLI